MEISNISTVYFISFFGFTTGNNKNWFQICRSRIIREIGDVTACWHSELVNNDKSLFSIILVSWFLVIMIKLFVHNCLLVLSLTRPAWRSYIMYYLSRTSIIQLTKMRFPHRKKNKASHSADDRYNSKQRNNNQTFVWRNLWISGPSVTSAMTTILAGSSVISGIATINNFCVTFQRI